MHIKVPMTAELYTKLIEDAGRHLRSTDLHIIYLLREAMGLEFPDSIGFSGKQPGLIG
jgi:hypothetical protein